MIEIQNLNFGYKNKELLFDHLSLQLQPGSITGLLGKNGAGKTTLLKLISGLIYPKGGNVKVGGHKPQERKASFLSDLYFVPEEFALPSISIKNHVKANSPFYHSFDHVLLDRLLNEFELSVENIIDKMSYGQKKKYLISFSLATKCRLLILDEPTNGLDIPSKDTFRKVLAGSLDDDQLVLISTHQVKDVENLIDTILILDHGKVIFHKNLFDISTQFYFGQAMKLDDEVIYSETSPNGFSVIKPQINGNSPVNIELLFNAISKGTRLIENE